MLLSITTSIYGASWWILCLRPLGQSSYIRPVSRRQFLTAWSLELFLPLFFHFPERFEVSDCG
jgi:hypothetical protein